MLLSRKRETVSAGWLAAATIVITGLHHEQIKLTDPGNGAVIDLTGGKFLALEDAHFPLGEKQPGSWPARSKKPQWRCSNAELYPVTIRGNSANVVLTGGTIQGMMDPRAPWHVWKEYADGAGLRVEGEGTYEIKNVAIKNVEDGIDPRGPAGAKFYIHDVFMDQIHDDMVENDAIHSGTIADSYMRGHTFLSARGKRTDSQAVVQIRNVVVELILQPHQGDHGPTDINTRGGYPFPDGLGNGSIFKWSGSSGGVDVRDSVFLVHRAASSSNKAMRFAPGAYSNVTIVWLGQGSYPAPAPPGVTITRDRAVFDRTVKAFFVAHPKLVPDRTAP
ncbi:MAG: hypothetical protein HY288_16950 [Planctomycetia bacterium]|nr:hypothetical protein [Planctomycetia bacterium]